MGAESSDVRQDVDRDVGLAALEVVLQDATDNEARMVDAITSNLLPPGPAEVAPVDDTRHGDVDASTDLGAQ